MTQFRQDTTSDKLEMSSFTKTRPTAGSGWAPMLVLLLLALQLLIASAGVALGGPSNGNYQVPNFLLFSSQDSKNNNSVSLIELLTDSSHNHASERVDLQLANSVWRRMRHNALEFAKNRVDSARPSISRLIEHANVSSQCGHALQATLTHLAKLDLWAVQMYNAFGDFPAQGFIEGSLNSMGSYHQCVEVEPNELIGHAQYCSFKFQPLVPKRPRYHNILAPIQQLANFTDKQEMFNHLAKKAQYFYYTKLRLAACMPSKCEKSDLEKLAKEVAVNTYLQYSGVSCLQKPAGFAPDQAQVFALGILLSLAMISLLGTLIDTLNVKAYLKRSRATKCRLFATGPQSKLDLTRLAAGKQQMSELKLVQKFKVSEQVTDPSQLDSINNNNNNNETAPLAPASELGGEPLKQQAKSLHQQPTGCPKRLAKSKLQRLVATLVHFSLIRNARKLFDTSTSATQSRRPLAASNRPTESNRCNSGTGSACCSEGAASTSSVSSLDQEEQSTSRSSDISCVHGLRFWTIAWIIFGHTMQYTEWAGFGRAYQVEQNIVSFYLHPMLNATFSVDTFFLISGLLTTYVTWTISGGQYKRFNKFAFLISRYLRLTPQVLIVMLLFIVFPLMGDGPYWKGLIQKESDNCKQNWWVGALYLQAFVRQDRICNLVTWWLSIEMFYHFVSIVVIIALLKSTRRGLMVALTIGGLLTSVSCYLHYVNSYPPNMLPTLLQRYEVWDSIVLRYFWTPYPHAAAYFTGLILGYVLYSRNSRLVHLSKSQVRFGWSVFTVCYLTILYGTYFWNKNAPYSAVTSTLYYNLSQVVWALATGWAIMACALGHGGFLNTFLSSPFFIPLGRSTYMTYLSHMLIVMAYPAKMNLLIEPSYIVFLYIFISNLFLSYALGIFLTLVYESPILHLQKMLVSKMATTVQLGQPSSKAAGKPVATNNNNNNNDDLDKSVRVALYAHEQNGAAAS